MLQPEPAIHVVDDDHAFLDALQRSLRSTGVPVRGHAHARAFLDTLDAHPRGCVVTDLRMPDIDGLQLQQALLQRQIRLPLIFITGHGDTHAAVTALKNGAMDFLEKPFSEHQLLTSVSQALAHEAREHELMLERSVVRQRCGSLSPRERQVFELVVSDRPNKAIALALKISPRTVEHHREHLMLKMQARSQADLITMAVLCGIHELHLSS